MAYRAFYSCGETGKELASDRAHEFDLGAAASLAVDVLRNDGDFFGLIDDRDQTLQFLRDGDDVWMEIPVPAERGSYGTMIGLDEVPSIIRALPRSITREAFPELSYQAW